MALALAFLEGSALFAAVCSVMVWTTPSLLAWTSVGAILSPAFQLSLCCLVAFYYNDLYDLAVVRTVGGVASRLLQALGFAFVLLAVLYAFFPDWRIGRDPFVVSVLVIAALCLSIRGLVYTAMRSRRFNRRVLILGASPLSLKLIAEIDAHPHVGYRIIGVADDAGPTTEPFPYPVRGPLEHLDKIIEELHPDRIIVALSERRGRLPVQQLLEARRRGILAEDGLQVYERLTGKVAIEALTPSQLIFSADFRKSRFDLLVSRVVSLGVALVALIVLAPVLALVALAVKLDSRGSTFFVQDRVGLHGRSFKLIKFRTMHPSNGHTSEWARDNSYRITRVGRWLRHFRLDELPQLLNVLRGDLNLVGPRPHPVSNFAHFMEHIPYYALRSVARPGVTGWAQIRYGYANDLAEETEKMRYDLYYIKHLSPWLDLRILFDTAKIVLLAQRAN
jgi:exopolysaccharide biosynthesis polyprenyl glycosylphosphotransferase